MRASVRVRSGFTLLELLVVLVIIGLAAGFVGPRLAGSLGGVQLKTASKKVAGVLRYARSRATAESVGYRTMFDARRGVLRVEPDPENRGPARWEGTIPEEDGISAQRYRLPDGVRFRRMETGIGESTETSVLEIYFFPSGGSSGGRVYLSDGTGDRYRVEVDFITGTVRLETGGDDIS